MKQVTLSGTTLKVSRLSFGTGGLFNAGSPTDRSNLLYAAYDNGFTHFDTAPYYGFGAAESDLKSFLAAHPRATVTTKVGLYSPGGENQPDAFVFARKALGKVVPALSRPIANWSVERAKRALEASLKRLGREKVDVYLLHEPQFALIKSDEWLQWLTDEQRVGAFGIAGNATNIEPFLNAQSPLTPIIQTMDSLVAKEADAVMTAGRALQFTYGYVSATPKGSKIDVDEILSEALQRNKTGSILVFTRKTERLSQYAKIVARSDLQT